MSALHQWSKRHSEDGRDEMRTGGSLSFNEEWSSPVGLRKQQPIERYGLRLHNRIPTLLLTGLSVSHTVSKTGELCR